MILMQLRMMAQSLMDRTKSDARSMIEDANNRFKKIKCLWKDMQK